MKRVLLVFALVWVVVLAGFGFVAWRVMRLAPGEVTFPAIEASAVLQHTTVLASDEFEGRAPGTRGEERTVSYLVDEFRRAGLKPGSPDGTYFQEVPLVGITPDPSVTLTLATGAATRRLAFKDDVVLWTKRMAEAVSLDESELVFVGYGVQAPEFDWDDYKGADRWA